MGVQREIKREGVVDRQVKIFDSHCMWLKIENVALQLFSL